MSFAGVPIQRIVTSDEVAAYQGMVESHARRFNGTMHAEYDDLVQEGLIAVWEALRDGFNPSNVVVVNAMRDWVRVCARQGFTDGDPITSLSELELGS